MTTDKNYIFHSDPGHGWVEISLKELRSLNISVTQFSYYDYAAGKAYLEEDCDAGKAIAALKESGINPVFNEISYNSPCFIRDLYRFDITEIKSPGFKEI